ncbi:protein shisa-8 [Aplochiton taeniatus]
MAVHSPLSVLLPVVLLVFHLLFQPTSTQEPTLATALQTDPGVTLPPQPSTDVESTLVPETGLSTPTGSGDLDDEDAAPTTGTRCRGYYDVMGQWDPPFNCNAGVFLHCCGTCFYRFCCQFRPQRLDQSSCSNYDTPIWANTGKPVAAVTEGQGHLERDRTHMIVYIICGVVAIMVLVGIFTKLALEKTRGGAGSTTAQSDLSNSRALTELLKQPGVEVSSMDSTISSPPLGIGANGFSARMLRSRSEQYHLNNAGFPPFGPGLPHPHSNLSGLGLNKYTSLKAVADTASRGYYKSYPLMDFSHYQPPGPPAFQPVALQLKDKSYLHQASMPPAQHDLHSPLSISIPQSHLERARLPSSTTAPLLSSSAFKSWDSSGRHIQRQTSHPGHMRRHAYSTRRQYSIENLPELYNQPHRGGSGYGPSPGQGLVLVQGQLHPSQPSYYHHTRHKSYSSHSKTEVTV